ncbi:hypothetical protein VHEMI04296 [[Torrubiella] hemipterigena]|uniref:Alpha/beta hydrolase fold-3 domain-containing protein n=1 Tax=[Torrubiella] hemipterigena TaxID=1531966 RepID=A0A0A1TDE5_9HYPO|nr:hypothetical protein VHEMI04296 [[Torrubiella] hemipterigena]
MSPAEEQQAAARHAIDKFRKNAGATVSQQQAATAKDRPIPEGFCVSKVKIPPPEATDARAHFLEAVANLSTDQEAFTLPKYGDWEGEWIGSTQKPQAALDELSQKDKFDIITRERKSDVVIMHVHGGAYMFGSPITARSITLPLSALTGGRCFAVRYRLAPQVQALSLQLDIFMAYLSLLYPPPGAFHSPISPESIVFAGDSCGASMTFFIIQLILELRRKQNTQRPTVRWYGQVVHVPLPAGATALSFAGDHLLCLPSYTTNLQYDMMNSVPPYRSSTGVVDALWPSDPPRGDISCELSAMTSIVYNPYLADSWRGSPPLYLACGEERLSDGSKLLAQQAAADGVIVRFEEYACMPHSFAAMLPKLPQTKRCLGSWAKFIMDCAGRKSMQSEAVRVEIGNLQESKLDLSKLVNFTRSEALDMMKAKRRTLRPWTGPDITTKL